MPIVTGSELARLRTDSARWLTEFTQLRRVAPTPDGKGGYTNARTVVWSGRASRRPMTESGREAMERTTGDLATMLSHWVFTFPAGTDVQHQDEIVAAGRTFQVVSGLDKSIAIACYIIATEVR